MCHMHQWFEIGIFVYGYSEHVPLAFIQKNLELSDIAL